LHENWDHVAIFEDDFYFTQNEAVINERLSKFLNAVPNFDLLMFSANIQKTTPTPNCQVADRCIKVLAGSGYVVNKPFYHKLRDIYKASLDELSSPRCTSQNQIGPFCRPIDVMWESTVPTAQWYVFNPLLGHQRPGFSNIENKGVDYSRVGAFQSLRPE